MIQTKINVVKDPSGGTRPALLSLPDDYSTSNTSYPVLFFFHGLGEGGNDLSIIYNSSAAGGPAYYIEHGKWPSSFINPADGNSYKFIVISPQFPGNTSSTTAAEFSQMLKWTLANYRIDANRIYATGLSAGGLCIVDYITHYNNTPLYSLAAVVPMSAQIGQPSQASVNQIVADKTNVWGFGSMTDIYGIQTRLLCVGAFNGNGGTLKGPGALGQFTEYVGGHCCWGQFYDPAYKGVAGDKTMNIYQWMLQFSKGIAVQSPVIVPPITPPPVVIPPVVVPKTIKSITITYSDGSQEIKP